MGSTLHCHVLCCMPKLFVTFQYSLVLFLDWKPSHTIREHGAMALESRVVDFLFYTSNERLLHKRYRASKGVSKR